MSLTLKDAKIVRQWSVMLPECQGEAPGFMKVVQDTLAHDEVPELSWKEESASTGLLKGLMGKRRDVLVVRNEKFSEWLVCIGAQAYGRFLNVSWFLTVSPSFMNKVRGAASAVAGEGNMFLNALDVFDQQDVDAFASVTRMAVHTAVDQLAKKRQIDVERLERCSRGPAAVG